MMVLQTSPLPLGYHSKRLLKYNKYQVLCQSGQTHYKQKSRIFGSQSRLRDSKPHNNVLHAFCGIETIELPLLSSHKKSVFEPRPAPSRKHYGKAFIMRLPCYVNKTKTFLWHFSIFITIIKEQTAGFFGIPACFSIPTKLSSGVFLYIWLIRNFLNQPFLLLLARLFIIFISFGKKVTIGNFYRKQGTTRKTNISNKTKFTETGNHKKPQ